MEDRYIRILLDDKGAIVDFKSTLADVVPYTLDEVVGKNWFDMFISKNDKEILLAVFKDSFTRVDTWTSSANDITCRNGTHKLMHFHNKLTKIDGQNYLDCIGVEHHEANTLDRIVKSIFR